MVHPAIEKRWGGHHGQFGFLAGFPAGGVVAGVLTTSFSKARVILRADIQKGVESMRLLRVLILALFVGSVCLQSGCGNSSMIKATGTITKGGAQFHLGTNEGLR